MKESNSLQPPICRRPIRKQRQASLTQSIFAGLPFVPGMAKEAGKLGQQALNSTVQIGKQRADVSRAFKDYLGRSLHTGPNVAFAGGVGDVSSYLKAESRADGVGKVSGDKESYLSMLSGGSGDVVKGTGKTVSDYFDDIIVNGKVDANKMNKLKNAIQNNTFSVDELTEIRKRMSELGITKEYDEALIKMDFGKYLRGLIGDPPSAMINPHAHHILFKKGLGQKQQELVREGQEILRRYGIDPIIGEENLVWAPNAVVGQHSLDALEEVVNRLRAVESEGGDLDDIVETLEELGVLASRR